MNPVLKNILAVIAGIVVGSVVNSALVNLGPKLITPPAGADITTMEGLKSTMHLFEPKHFLFPFLAHALGTLVGAFIAVKIAASRHKTMALIIGFLFLIGGLLMIVMVPGPTWFNAIDIVLAYIPMA